MAARISGETERSHRISTELNTPRCFISLSRLRNNYATRQRHMMVREFNNHAEFIAKRTLLHTHEKSTRKPTARTVAPRLTSDRQTSNGFRAGTLRQFSSRSPLDYHRQPVSSSTSCCVAYRIFGHLRYHSATLGHTRPWAMVQYIHTWTTSQLLDSISVVPDLTFLSRDGVICNVFFQIIWFLKGMLESFYFTDRICNFCSHNFLALQN